MARFPSRHPDRYPVETQSDVRQEIAMRAGRLIAEEGLDYANAKRKAARDILGTARTSGDWLPDNSEVEEEVRAYQALFQSDTQPLRLLQLRQAALHWMRKLAAFRPYLCGAVWNGTAGAHSNVHLQLFCDSPKDVQIYLLNQGIEFEVGEVQDSLSQGRQNIVEVVQFLWRAQRGAAAEGIVLELHDTNALRGALNGDRRGERADLLAVEALVVQPPERAA